MKYNMLDGDPEEIDRFGFIDLWLETKWQDASRARFHWRAEAIHAWKVISAVLEHAENDGRLLIYLSDRAPSRSHGEIGSWEADYTDIDAMEIRHIDGIHIGAWRRSPHCLKPWYRQQLAERLSATIRTFWYSRSSGDPFRVPHIKERDELAEYIQVVPD
jgi:hypothetical protein